MASRRSKDKGPAKDPNETQLVKREPTSSLQTINRFTTLGTIPKPNYSSVLASSYDPYSITPVHQPIRTSFPRNTSQYIRKQYFQNLFSIEPNRSSFVDPLQLAKSYFPTNFHWIPEHGEKKLSYYSDLLRHERSIIINTISDQKDTSKIIYHSVYIVNVITEREWGSSPNVTRMMPKHTIPYSYHDYITAWFRFMLHQNDTMSHSWFVNFDKNYTGTLPFWFARWWSQFGLIIELFPTPLLEAFKLFEKGFKPNPHTAKAKFPALLYFVNYHKIPWILKWQYVINIDENALSRYWYVKWWDKFSHIQKIIATTNRECSKFINEKCSPSSQIPTEAYLPSSSSTKTVKPKKKSSPLDDLRRDPDALFALLKCAENLVASRTTEEEKSTASSEESVANNPYLPYDKKLFGHDEDSPQEGEF